MKSGKRRCCCAGFFFLLLRRRVIIVHDPTFGAFPLLLYFPTFQLLTQRAEISSEARKSGSPKAGTRGRIREREI